MSSVCVLTPIVVSSWPAIASAVVGVAASMGFTVLTPEHALQPAKTGKKRVETEVPNSEVLQENLGHGEKIRIQRGDIEIEFGRDERGACTVCVTGERHSKAELTRIGEEVAGKVVQQFTYHKLMTELSQRSFRVLEESAQADGSIQVRVRLDR